MSKVCDICGSKAGLISQEPLKDGMACFDCMKKLGEGFTPYTKSFTVEQVKKAIAGEITLTPPKLFQCTNGVLVFDLNNRIMYMSKALGVTTDEIPFDSIIGYSYVEREREYGALRIIKWAVILGLICMLGGPLLGVVGAIIGGIIGSRPKHDIKYMGVDINYEHDGKSEILKAAIFNGEKILNGDQTKKEGFLYKEWLDDTRQLMGQLELVTKKRPVKDAPERDLRDTIAANNSASPSETSVVAVNSSSADEIRKYKNLLDEGIITQEEFDSKKKNLLGL